MTTEQQKFYSLGHQAREAGYSVAACNIRGICSKRSAWLAGWHDADMELKREEQEVA